MSFGKNDCVIEKLYREQSKAMYYTAYAVLHDRCAAEDAVQESFLKILKSPHRFRYFSTAQTTAFCNIVCKNTALNMLKKNGDEISADLYPDLLPCAPSAEDDTVKREELEELTHFVLKLSEKDREILYLRYNMGYKVKEIAAFLCIGEESAKKRLQRARSSLEKKMKGECE